MYFTITIFATVGCGDITPDTGFARLVTTSQTLLDLAVLGLGIQVVLEAVQRGRSSTS